MCTLALIKQHDSGEAKMKCMHLNCGNLPSLPRGRMHLDASPKGPTGDEDSSASDVALCTSRSKLFDNSLSSPVSLPGSMNNWRQSGQKSKCEQQLPRFARFAQNRARSPCTLTGVPAIYFGWNGTTSLPTHASFVSERVSVTSTASSCNLPDLKHCAAV
jgi:hypothetical protein